jgi:hypothetical protein
MGEGQWGSLVKFLEELFPGLAETGYRITSPPDDSYNCIAWAVGVTHQWWWPLGDVTKSNWPQGVPRQETVEAFLATLAICSFTICDTADLESGFEKIAIYADARGSPSHAARQLENGRWTSKLGVREDIEHDLHALEGTEYGKVVAIVRRVRELTRSTAER